MDVSLRTVALSEIAEAVGAPPSSRLKSSVRKLGIVQPVLLAESTNHSDGFPYLIIDGNRRIRAAKGARHKQVPALVVSGLTPEERAQMTLVSNGYRTTNYLTEFWAIKQLQRANFANQEIEGIAGFGDTAIATRNLLTRLNREIFVALRNGKVNQSNALAVSKLPRDDQQELAEILKSRGRLLKREIDEVAKNSSKAPASPVAFSSPESPNQPGQISVSFARPTSNMGQVQGSQIANCSTPLPSDFRANSSETSGAAPVSQGISLAKAPTNGVHDHQAPQPTTALYPEARSQSESSNSDQGATHSLNPFVESAAATQTKSVSDPSECDSIVIPDSRSTGEPGMQLPSASSHVERLMRNTVVAARVMDYSLEDFIELATAQWNSVHESVDQTFS